MRGCRAQQNARLNSGYKYIPTENTSTGCLFLLLLFGAGETNLKHIYTNGLLFFSHRQASIWDLQKCVWVLERFFFGYFLITLESTGKKIKIMLLFCSCASHKKTEASLPGAGRVLYKTLDSWYHVLSGLLGLLLGSTRHKEKKRQSLPIYFLTVTFRTADKQLLTHGHLRMVWTRILMQGFLCQWNLFFKLSYIKCILLLQIFLTMSQRKRGSCFPVYSIVRLTNVGFVPITFQALKL